LAGSVCSFAQTPVTLRFADIHPPDYPTTIADFEIAKIVKEKTNGRVILDVHHSQKLGDEVSVIKKVRDGEIDLTRMNIAPITAHVTGLNAFQIPFVFRAETYTKH
jgi:TRAP-type C4-dicarboxylate transport system substrate-binding protein